VHKHYRTLTPAVTSAAEALVGEFYDSIKGRMPRCFTLSPKQYARLLMRHPQIAPFFANCLQHYMTSLDQTRGGRNPSYKQITSVTTGRCQSFKRFTAELESRAAELAVFYRAVANLEGFYFHPYLVDWHAIAGQLPEAHRHFAKRLDNLALRHRRAREDREPWRVR
jgi:hypothetical protein